MPVVKNFSFRDKLAMEACTGCFMCEEVCPAVATAGDGCLSGIYRIEQLKKILRSQIKPLKWLFGKKALNKETLGQFAETVYRCTLCGRCQEVCPAGIHLKELWISLRSHLVDLDAYPKKVDMIRDNLSESYNVFGEDNEERADWVEDMPGAPEHGYVKERAEVVYFTGCVAAYFPMAQKIPAALVQILDAAGVDFTLLGEQEWCCGFPLIGAGLKDAIPEYCHHNLEAVRAKGAGKVIFACPSCYQMWLEYYPDEFPIFHVTEFISELIKAKRIPMKSLDRTVTYHDPCDLGRGAGVYEAPRHILNSIPGVNFVELPRNREACQCCGGGGNLEMIDADLSAGIAREKVKEIQQTGAQTVVSACQQCVRTINTYARRNKLSLDVLDIIQLVHQAMSTG